MATPTPKPLSPQQMRAIEALLTHDTLGAAAVAAAVPERTLRRWRSTPAFASALAEAARQVWGLSLARLQQLASQAPAVLERNMNACARIPNPRLASVEVRAVAVLLQHLRDSELAELSARVAALESRGNET